MNLVKCSLLTTNARTKTPVSYVNSSAKVPKRSRTHAQVAHHKFSTRGRPNVIFFSKSRERRTRQASRRRKAHFCPIDRQAPPLDFEGCCKLSRLSPRDFELGCLGAEGDVLCIQLCVGGVFSVRGRNVGSRFQRNLSANTASNACKEARRFKSCSRYSMVLADETCRRTDRQNALVMRQ